MATEKTDMMKGLKDMGIPPADVGISNQGNALSREAIEAVEYHQVNAAGLIMAGPTPLEILEKRVSDLELRLMNPAIPPPVASRAESIEATMVGGIFNCPECGLRISSPALISTQGLKTGGYYEHPFEESPRLGGQKCRLIGKKFASPIVTLKMIAPKAPAPKLDVQETIGV